MSYLHLTNLRNTIDAEKLSHKYARRRPTFFLQCTSRLCQGQQRAVRSSRRRRSPWSQSCQDRQGQGITSLIIEFAPFMARQIDYARTQAIVERDGIDDNESMSPFAALKVSKEGWTIFLFSPFSSSNTNGSSFSWVFFLL